MWSVNAHPFRGLLILLLKLRSKTNFKTKPKPQSTEPNGTLLQADTFKQRVDEIKTEWNGTRSKTKLNLLMSDTRANRRQMIKNGMSVKDIMENFPSFGDACYIMDDFSFIINPAEPQNGREMIEARSKTLFETVTELSSDADKGSEDGSVDLLRVFEKKLTIKQGKGTKSKTVLTVIEMDSIDDDKLAKKLSPKEDVPMAIRVITVDHIVKQIFLVGEGQCINCNTTDVIEALMLLLGVYYVFYLDYPAISLAFSKNIFWSNHTLTLRALISRHSHTK